MNDDYSVENLVKRFKVHHEHALKEQKEREEKHMKEFGTPIPIYGPDAYFNLSLALMSICSEIIDIKESFK